MTAVRAVVRFLRSPEYAETDVDDRLLGYLKKSRIRANRKISLTTSNTLEETPIMGVYKR